MQFHDYQSLRFDYRDRVLRVTIASKARMNGVDARLHEELARVFPELRRDPDSDLIVLTGAGQAFCAGGDMGWFHDMIDVRGFGSGERVVFLPYTRETYERSQEWMRERHLFEDAAPAQEFASVVEL